jgi:hypothetical protein
MDRFPVPFSSRSDPANVPLLEDLEPVSVPVFDRGPRIRPPERA